MSSSSKLIMRRLSAILVSMLALLSVTSTYAQNVTPADSRLEKRFAAANTTKDGKLTLEQAKKGMPRVAKNFDKIDVAHHGYVTLDEIKAAMVNAMPEKK